MRLVWTPLALERAEGIARFIAVGDVAAANSWVDSLFDAVEQLLDFPELGRMVPEVERREIREIIRGSYRIIYRVDEGRIAVLTVRHSRRRFDPTEI